MSRQSHFQHLRERALSLGPDSSIAVAPNLNGVYAFLMESTFDDVTMTLVTVADGAVSLYLSVGSGIIGSGQIPEIRECARGSLEVANAKLQIGEVDEGLELPASGRTKFYLITESGIRSREFLTEELQNDSHPFGLLFYRSQNLISAIRSKAPIEFASPARKSASTSGSTLPARTSRESRQPSLLQKIYLKLGFAKHL